MKTFTKIGFAVGFSILASSTQAQFVNGADIYVGKDAVIALNTDIKNTGTIDAQGKLYARKNIENQGDFNSETLVFDGASLQTVSGKKSIVANNVVFAQNSRNDAVVLQNQLRINNSADFQGGLVEARTGSPLVFAQNAKAINASAASHVRGPVTKEGSGEFTFPIGDGTIYRPCLAQPTSSNAVTVEYISANPLSVSENLSDEVASINTQEYWTINGSAPVKIKVLNGSATDEGILVLNNEQWAVSRNGEKTSTTLDLSGKKAFTTGLAGNSETTSAAAFYPNPSQGEIFVNLTGFSDDESITMKISDMTGRVLMSKDGLVKNFKKSIELPTHVSGSQFMIRLERPAAARTYNQKVWVSR